MKFTTGTAILALSVAQTALAHTGFTNFYVNGKNQGDAVCVRMNTDPSHWNSPIADITGPDLACGYSGTVGVNRVCPVPDGAAVTFEWREDPQKPGVPIDPSHKGPCAVYAKKVDSAIKDGAAGDGWFKIWHEGYDEAAGKWCTEKLIAANGLMTVNLPKGLLGGNYLLRPELLALHAATSGDPQYYTGCAQVFLQSSGNLGPASTVSIPGAVSKSDPADSYNIYTQPLKLPYPIPGPELATFKPSTATAQTTQTEGLRPADCMDESGSNWCGVEVPAYTTQADCWTSGQNCWTQNDACWKSAPATGGASCTVWSQHCKDIQADCTASKAGPANPGKDITPVKKDITPPSPLGSMSAAGGSGSTPTNSNSTVAASVAAAVGSKAAAVVPSGGAVAKAPSNNYGYSSAMAAKASAAPVAPKASAAPAVGSAADATAPTACPAGGNAPVYSTVTVTSTVTKTVVGTAPSAAPPAAKGSVADASAGKGGDDGDSCDADEAGNEDGDDDGDDGDCNGDAPPAKQGSPAPAKPSSAAGTGTGSGYGTGSASPAEGAGKGSSSGVPIAPGSGGYSAKGSSSGSGSGTPSGSSSPAEADDCDGGDDINEAPAPAKAASPSSGTHSAPASAASISGYHGMHAKNGTAHGHGGAYHHKHNGTDVSKYMEYRKQPYGSRKL